MTRALRSFGINENGRDFVVGDLHGCIAEFDILLKRLSFDFQKDRMFSVGDLVDRGPDSMACLRLLREPWFFAVLGNHEDMMLNAIASDFRTGVDHWVGNGGDWGLERFYDGDPEFFDLAEIADALPLAMTIQTKECGLVGVSHAEPPTLWTNECVDEEMVKLLWSRKKIYETQGSLSEGGVKLSVHGHTIVDEVTWRDDVNAYWIDLGCYSKGRLCALQIGGENEKQPTVHIVESR